MSCCLILQQYDDFYIGSDSAGSILIDGHFHRTSNNMNKIFHFGTDTYFCSGISDNVDICNNWIVANNQNCIDINLLRKFLISTFNISNHKECFDIEFLICRIEDGISKVYHLAQYNNFDINVYDGRKNKINIICGGCKTMEGFQLTRDMIICGDVKKIYTKVFQELSDERIGGTLSIYYNQNLFYKYEIDNYKIDTHMVLADALVGGYIEGSEIHGGTLEIGGNGGMFVVHEDGSWELKRTSDGGATYYDAIAQIENSRQYHIQLLCDGSTILTNKNQSTTITCKVYKWDEDITSTLPIGTKFKWIRSSNVDDTTWNNSHIITKSSTNTSTCNQITITNSDVTKNAQFSCQVEFEE